MTRALDDRLPPPCPVLCQPEGSEREPLAAPVANADGTEQLGTSPSLVRAQAPLQREDSNRDALVALGLHPPAEEGTTFPDGFTTMLDPDRWTGRFTIAIGRCSRDSPCRIGSGSVAATAPIICSYPLHVEGCRRGRYRNSSGHVATRRPCHVGPSRTNFHSGFLATSRRAAHTARNVGTSASAHSK